MANEVKYIITADSSGAIKGVKQFEDAVSNSGNKVKDTSSVMTQSWGKVAAAAAAVLVVYKSLEQAVEKSKIGSDIQKQEIAFSNLAKSADVSYKHILSNLTGVSKGMVAQADLIKSAGTAMMMGIPADKLAGLMKIAEATARQTGQTVTEAFADITLAVSRQSKMILDNLGIIIDVDKANQEYAKTLGKTSDALSDTEKKQAFMNATLKIGNDLVKKIGEGRADLDAADRLAASFKNLMNESYKVIATLLNPALEKSTGLMDMLTKAAKEFRQIITPAGQAIKGLTTEQMRKEVEQYDKMGPVQRAGAYTGQQINQIEAMRKALKEYDYSRGESEAILSDANIARVYGERGLKDEAGRNKGRGSNITLTKYEQEELERLEKQRLQLEKDAQDANEETARKAKKNLEELQRLQEIKNQGDKQWAEMKMKLDGTAYDLELEKLHNVLGELQKKGSINKEQADEYVKAWKDAYMQVESHGYGYEAVDQQGNRSMNVGLSEAELADTQAMVEYKKNIDLKKQWEIELSRMKANISGNEKDMYKADLAEIESWYREQVNKLPHLVELWNELKEAKIKALEIKYQSPIEKWADKEKSYAEKMKTSMENIYISASEKFSSGFSDAFMTFVEGTKSAKDAFKDFAASFLQDISRMIMQQMILNAIKSATSYGFADGGIAPGGFTAFADGGIAPGGFKAFAGGGVVNKPTLGLVGEGKFNEAIVPLPDGKSIPVQMQGGGTKDVNVTINVDGGKGGTPEQNDKMAKQIAREVKDQVKLILADERRYGGVLGRNSQRVY